MFEKNGIVSNAVDLATVPNLIRDKQHEVDQIEVSLYEFNSRYAYLADDLVTIDALQRESEEIDGKLAAIEDVLQSLLGSETRDTKTIAEKSGELHTMTEKLNTTKQELDIRTRNNEQARSHYTTEKASIEERLANARHELVELEEKLKRKKGQMSGNLGGIGKR